MKFIKVISLVLMFVVGLSIGSAANVFANDYCAKSSHDSCDDDDEDHTSSSVVTTSSVVSSSSIPTSSSVEETTTTIEDSTSTSVDDSTTTSVEESTPPVPSTTIPDKELPATGSNINWIVAIGFILVGFGTIAVIIKHIN
jgi:LPXTG-motif cell wall-anchored protein